MKLKFIIGFIFVTHTVFAQWSTKPYADSGLYVCPGFLPGIVTYDDGSSVVLGLLSSYIFAQKLDPYGYKMWQQPVMVFHNDSSQMNDYTLPNGTSWFCSDGDGGVILFWQDYRGAYLPPIPFSRYQNNTTHIQRVDKYGNVRWSVDGITVNSLAEGFSTARITSDGESGCVILFAVNGFGYPDAPNKNYLKLARYNANGEQLWCTVLDSSTNIGGFDVNNILKGGMCYYLSFYNESGIQIRLINENGSLTSYKTLPLSGVSVLSNENVFLMDYTNSQKYYKVSVINTKGDTLWDKILDFKNFCLDFGGGLPIPDTKGGVYLIHICNDSIIYFDSIGNLKFMEFNRITNFSNYFFMDGHDGILAANGTTVVRYDNTGKLVWSDSVIYLSDPLNAEYKFFMSDNNGGLIIVYWSINGGIFAQHTGRTGKLGLLTNVNNPRSETPNSFVLKQNFPNPFNGTTQIEYNVAEKSKILLNVYDVLGRKVKTVIDEVQEKGTYSVQLDLPAAASGTYFYRLMCGGNVQTTRRMLLAK